MILKQSHCEQYVVSVIMSVYNECKNFNLIQSNLELYKDNKTIEFVVVNDGSTDNSLDYLLSIKNTNLTIITKKNSGLASALNLGIKQSKGKYIARIDADDAILPKRFERQLDYLERNGYDLIGSWCRLVENDKESIVKTPVSNNDILRHIAKDNPFIHSTIFCKKEVFEKLGFYNESFRFMQDYELWIRIVDKINCGNLPEATVIRYEDNNFSTRETYKNLKKWQYYDKKYKLLLVALFKYKNSSGLIRLLKNFTLSKIMMLVRK
jgi:glycosyltransferase involved in cell wall biosynthesis